MKKKHGIIEISNTPELNVTIMCGNEVAAYYAPLMCGIADAVQSLNEYRDKIIDFDGVMFDYVQKCEIILKIKLERSKG